MGEYEDFVKSISASERVPEPFTSIDNRLDFLGPKIIDMKNRVERLEDALATMEIGGVIMPRKIEQIPYAYTLAVAGAVGSGVILEENTPFSGYIKQVTIHWPAGANALVDVRIGHGVKQFCPDEGFLALNDATPTYPFSEWVNDHETTWVEMRNRDGGFEHSITVTVTLEGAV